MQLEEPSRPVDGLLAHGPDTNSGNYSAGARRPSLGVVFPAQANGSLIVKDGKVVGSELIGQQFSDPKHFWGRGSATSPYPYNAASSSGSNQGPSNPALTEPASESAAYGARLDDCDLNPALDGS